MHSLLSLHYLMKTLKCAYCVGYITGFSITTPNRKNKLLLANE